MFVYLWNRDFWLWALALIYLLFRYRSCQKDKSCFLLAALSLLTYATGVYNKWRKENLLYPAQILELWECYESPSSFLSNYWNLVPSTVKSNNNDWSKIEWQAHWLWTCGPRIPHVLCRENTQKVHTEQRKLNECALRGLRSYVKYCRKVVQTSRWR